MEQEIEVTVKIILSADATLSKEEITECIYTHLNGSIDDCTRTGDKDNPKRALCVEQIHDFQIREEREIYNNE